MANSQVKKNKHAHETASIAMLTDFLVESSPSARKSGNMDSTYLGTLIQKPVETASIQVNSMYT